jgi:hypothetical protein
MYTEEDCETGVVKRFIPYLGKRRVHQYWAEQEDGTFLPELPDNIVRMILDIRHATFRKRERLWDERIFKSRMFRHFLMATRLVLRQKSALITLLQNELRMADMMLQADDEFGEFVFGPEEDPNAWWMGGGDHDEIDIQA